MLRRSCSERVCGQQYLPWEKIEFSVSFLHYTKGVVTKSKPIALVKLENYFATILSRKSFFENEGFLRWLSGKRKFYSISLEAPGYFSQTYFSQILFTLTLVYLLLLLQFLTAAAEKMYWNVQIFLKWTHFILRQFLLALVCCTKKTFLRCCYQYKRLGT